MNNGAAVEEFLAGIEAGAIPARVLWADVVFDATVPNWRYTVRGAGAVHAELGKWYADPGRFCDLRRTTLPDGELVQLTLEWQQDGERHRCHQAHVLQLRHGRVARDTVWCGGRWPASLIAEMEAAASPDQ